MRGSLIGLVSQGRLLVVQITCVYTSWHAPSMNRTSPLCNATCISTPVRLCLRQKILVAPDAVDIIDL